MRLTDPATGCREHVGLVEVQPARIALQAIQALNGKELAGTPIEVRRYRHRSQWGERRGRLDNSGSDPRAAGQIGERRRLNLKIELVESTATLQAQGRAPALA